MRELLFSTFTGPTSSSEHTLCFLGSDLPGEDLSTTSDVENITVAPVKLLAGASCMWNTRRLEELFGPSETEGNLTSSPFPDLIQSSSSWTVREKTPVTVQNGEK